MKRIIQCPKCQAKLAVFDLGKPINQKCPKCGNAFVVESESQKAPVEEAPVAAATAEAAPAAAKPETAPEKAGETPVEASGEKDAVKPPTKKNGKVKADKPAEAAAEKKTDAAEKKADTAEKKAEEKADAPADKGEAAAAAPAPSAPKEITLKKPEERPASSAPARAPAKPAAIPEPLAAEPVAHVCGFSFMHFLVVIGLLIIVVAMQAFAKVQSDKQYKKLIEHLQFIETKLGK